MLLWSIASKCGFSPIPADLNTKRQKITATLSRKKSHWEVSRENLDDQMFMEFKCDFADCSGCFEFSCLRRTNQNQNMLNMSTIQHLVFPTATPIKATFGCLSRVWHNMKHKVLPDLISCSHVVKSFVGDSLWSMSMHFLRTIERQGKLETWARQLWNRLKSFEHCFIIWFYSHSVKSFVVDWWESKIKKNVLKKLMQRNWRSTSCVGQGLGLQPSSFRLKESFVLLWRACSIQKVIIGHFPLRRHTTDLS